MESTESSSAFGFKKRIRKVVNVRTKIKEEDDAEEPSEQNILWVLCPLVEYIGNFSTEVVLFTLELEHDFILIFCF